MAIVDIRFRNSQFSLDVDNADKVGKLAERFSQRAGVVANQNNATDLKCALIAGIMVENELEQLQAQLINKKPNAKTISEGAIEVLTDTINQVSAYIEDLADRIENR